MARSVATHLMFAGTAEAALRLYQAVFPGFKVGEISRWQAGEPGTPGAFKRAFVRFGDQDVIVFDSPIKHEFGFTPAISFFIECESEAELEQAFAQLADGGQQLMPLGNYGFSTRFGWCNDRFGVSWQLNLA